MLWTVTLITLNSQGSTSRPRGSTASMWRRREQPMGVSVSDKHSTTRQKQERVLTVMPIDRSAPHSVRGTSWPIRFVWRQTQFNCKELQTAKNHSKGQRDIFSLNTFLWCIAQGIRIGGGEKRRQSEGNIESE